MRLRPSGWSIEQFHSRFMYCVQVSNKNHCNYGLLNHRTHWNLRSVNVVHKKYCLCCIIKPIHEGFIAPYYAVTGNLDKLMPSGHTPVGRISALAAMKPEVSVTITKSSLCWLLSLKHVFRNKWKCYTLMWTGKMPHIYLTWILVVKASKSRKTFSNHKEWRQHSWENEMMHMQRSDSLSISD